MELVNARGYGLRAEGLPLFGMSARHVSTADIEAAAYSIDLPRRPEVYLNLDMAQMGVGGIDSWTRLAYPMEPYRLSGSEPHTFRVRLRPLFRSQ